MFYDGNHVFGIARVVNGTAVLTTTALAQGNHTIYAAYQGDSNYEQLTTGTIMQMVFSTAPAALDQPCGFLIHSLPKRPTPKPKRCRNPSPHPVTKTSLRCWGGQAADGRPRQSGP